MKIDLLLNVFLVILPAVPEKQLYMHIITRSERNTGFINMNRES